MLIVEELHLLLTRPDGRVESAASMHRLFGAIAAVIVDLADHDRVVVTEEKNPACRWSRPSRPGIRSSTRHSLASHP